MNSHLQPDPAHSKSTYKKNEMAETRELFRKAIETLPALKALPNFSVMVDRMPDDAEFAALCAAFEASIEAEVAAGLDDGFDVSLEADLDVVESPKVRKAPPAVPAPCSARSKRITIRIPGRVLAAIKEEARLKCIPYQTFINRLLGFEMAKRKV